MVLRDGKLKRRSGAAVGAEIMGAVASEEPDGSGASVEVASASAFKGTGVKIEGETGISYSELKAQLRAGHWRPMLPFVLAGAGLLLTCVSVALILLIVIEDRFVALIFAGVITYTVVRIIAGFAKA